MGRSHPNVLFITVDALRADHLEVYGYERETSPELTKLAARGARFDAATVQAPSTVPSIFMMMTGELFYRGSIPPDIETLAERLKTRGYTTAAFIRNPLLELDASGTDRGFDTFFAPEAVVDIGPPEQENYKASEKQLYSADLRAEEILSRAEKWLQGNHNKEPFFLWIHLFDPHDPYTPPAPYDTQFEEAYGGNVDGDIRSTKDADRPIWGEVEENPPTEECRHINALYDGEVRYVSAQIGAFLEDFSKTRLSKRTLIVFSSDHGESLGEHKIWGHGISLYESELHVPLFMVLPGKIPAGMIVSRPVESVDLVPTILSLVGIEPDQALVGNDLTPLFRGGSVASTGVFAHWMPGDSYRRENWKLMTSQKRGFELYDLEADPGETTNLASHNAQRVQKMRDMLKVSFSRLTATDQDAIDSAKQKLKSLGYIQ